MGKKAEHILKSKDVEFKGRFLLNVEQTATNSAGKQANMPLITGQVRIVEKNPQFAMIEVTCSCSTKTYIKCDYADAQPDDREPDKTKGEK